MAIRVVLADDHDIVLRGLQAVLGTERDFEVVAQCRDGDETLQAIRAHQPDIAILDLRMPDRDGLAVLREIKKAGLPTRVVFLVAALEGEELLEALRLGVRGVVLKEMTSGVLIQCLRKVHAGETWLERGAAARAVETLLRRETGALEIARVLTSREIEIVRLLARGNQNREIGNLLSLSEATVKTHLHHIYEKLHVGSRTQLLAYCRDKGVI